MKTTRNLASVYVVVITAVIVLLSSGRLASSNASSTDYAVADSFDYPISGYDVTGFKFGKVGTYPDGTDKYHLGEDVLAPEGTEIKAMANGFVKYVKTYDSCAANSAFGTVVVVEHRLLSGDSAGNNAYSKYEHLRARDIKVTANTEIKKGDTIGYIGKKGVENGCWEPHLHFAIHKGAYSGDIRSYGDKNEFANWWKPSDFIAARLSVPSSNLSLALIIDSSGSMQINDPSGLRKQAAKLFIQALDPTHKLAVVDFDDIAQPIWPLQAVGDAQNKKKVSDKIDQLIDNSGGTNISGALEQTYKQFNNGEVGKKIAILLTDGKQEGSPYDPQWPPKFKRNGWPIYTFGLSNQADKTLLTDIAKTSDGEFQPLISDKQIKDFYDKLRVKITGASPILTQSIVMQQGQTNIASVIVPAYSQVATFITSWPGSRVDTVLQAPDGTIITPESNSPGVSHVKEDTFEIYRVQFPQVGTWQLRGYGAELAPDGELVTFKADVLLTRRHTFLPLLLNGDTSMLPPILTPTITPIPPDGPIEELTSTPTQPLAEPTSTPTNTPTATPTPTPTTTPAVGVPVLENLLIRNESWQDQTTFLPGAIIRLGMNGTVQGEAVPVSLWWNVVDSQGNLVPALSFANFEATIGPGFWGYDYSPTIPVTLSPGQYTYRGELHYNGQVRQRQASFTVTSPPSGNLLVNGDFEQDSDNDGKPDGWSINQRFTRSNEVVHGGSYAAKHFASNNTDYRVWQWMPGISGGAAYNLSGYVFIPSTSDTFEFEIEVSWWSDGGTNLISTVPIKIYTASTNGNWDLVTTDLVAPSGTQSATVRMVLTSLQGSIYVDDFSFRPQ